MEYRSKLEAYTAQQLTEARIPVNYEHKKFVLLDPFSYDGENIRAISYKPDFTGRLRGYQGFVIEDKGMMTDAFKLKWKLFKSYLQRNSMHLKLYLPRNQRDVREVVQDIVNRNKRNNKIKEVYEQTS